MMSHTSCGGIEPLAGINEIAEPDIDCISLCIMVLLDMRDETSPARATYPAAPPMIRAIRTALTRTIELLLAILHQYERKLKIRFMDMPS
jgi:hypothetical protein